MLYHKRISSPRRETDDHDDNQPTASFQVYVLSMYSIYSATPSVSKIVIHARTHARTCEANAAAFGQTHSQSVALLRDMSGTSTMLITTTTEATTKTTPMMTIQVFRVWIIGQGMRFRQKPCERTITKIGSGFIIYYPKYICARNGSAPSSE